MQTTFVVSQFEFIDKGSFLAINMLEEELSDKDTKKVLIH